MARTKKEKPVETPETKKEFDYKEINKRVIELSQLKKFTDIFVINSETFEHTYLDYCDEFKTTMKPYTRFVKVGTNQIAVHITQDQLEGIKRDFNIDVMPMLQNIVINEAAQYLSKNFMAHVGEIARQNYLKDYTRWDKIKVWAYKLVKKEYKKYTKIANIKELLHEIIKVSNDMGLKSKWSYGNFAVCNLKTATALQAESQFSIAAPEESSHLPGGLYPIGNIAGITIYVDPYMLWVDNNIYVGTKTQETQPGIKIFVYDEGTTSHLQSQGVGAPKMVFAMRYAVVSVGTSADLLYRKIEFKDDRKYPII